MKSANAYGSPSSAAQSALCGEEPSSHGSGARAAPAASREPRERVLGGQVLEVGEQLGELLGEVVGRRLAAVALQREGGQRVGARGAPEREVDAPGNSPASRLKLSATLSGL